MSEQLQAILWDVDGTIAETERDGHLAAFNAAFAELHVPWRWSEQHYSKLLRVAGGFERLLHDMQSQPLAPRDVVPRRDMAAQIHSRKNEIYTALVANGTVTLRPGVRELMDDCRTDVIPMAVVTTTSHGNVHALLGAQFGLDWQKRFAAVVCAEDAPRKKPDPQAYRVALERLSMDASCAVAIEDSPAGRESANAAGIGAIISRSRFFKHDRVPGALAVGPSLGAVSGWSPPVDNRNGRVRLAHIRNWLAAAADVEHHCRSGVELKLSSGR